MFVCLCACVQVPRAAEEGVGAGGHEGAVELAKGSYRISGEILVGCEMNSDLGLVGPLTGSRSSHFRSAMKLEAFQSWGVDGLINEVVICNVMDW